MSIDTALFGSLLEAEKLRLEEELARIGTPTTTAGEYTTRFNEVGEDEEDNAVEVTDYAGNLAVENTLEIELHKVQEALLRIKAGTYGSCSICGKEISLDRLRAYPAAINCLQHTS